MHMRKATYLLALPFIALLNGTITSIPGVGSIARLAAVPVAIAWLVGIQYGHGIRRLHWYHWTMLTFVFWNVLSYFWSISDSSSMENLSRYIPIVISSVMLWDIFRERTQVIGGLQAYVIGAYIICLSTLYGYFTDTSGAAISGRFSGVGFHPDDFAYLLAVPIAWELAIRNEIRSKALRLLNAVYPIMALITIVMTATRASIFVALPVYLCILAGIRRTPKAIRFGFAAAACGGVLLLSMSQFSASLGRLTAVHGSSDASTLNGRIYLWHAAYDLMGKYPAQGVGSGAFRTLSSFYPGVQYTEEGLPAHNTYLSVFSELGAIGFVLFLVVIGAVFWMAWQTEGGYRAAYITALMAFVIGSSALTYETHSQEWLLFVLILAHSCSKAPSIQLWRGIEHSQATVAEPEGSIKSVAGVIARERENLMTSSQNERHS